MFTASQFVAHLVGDFVIQSSWMANEKIKSKVPAAIHAITYTLPFLFLTRSIPALLGICVSHFVIDHWRLAKYVCWLKNFLAPRAYWEPWSECSHTGYSNNTPPWMATWLFIIADNTLHLICNGLFLRL